MSSRFRPLYDKLYMQVDVWLLGFNANRSGRKRAKKIAIREGFNREFKENVLPYWKKFGIRPKKFWYRIFCERSETVDPRFIPDDIWYGRVVPHFNHILFAQALQDKCLHNLYRSDFRRPETIVKNISGLFYDDALNLISEAEAVKRCMACERFIVKPSVGSGKGADIRFYNGTELSEEETKQMFAQYKNRNFIAQKPVRQHKVLSDIYDKALNTVRVVTFLYKGEAHVLSAVLRMGAGGSEVDNISKGGYACKVNMDGRLEPYAVDRQANWVTQHPGGAVFSGITLPQFDKLIERVKEAAKKTPHFRIIGWDFAIDEDAEPVFIEYNMIPEQNQKTWGPAFGDLSDEVLAEVFKK